jgi:hypothetical protein
MNDLKKKVLCVGFSVTEEKNGYVKHLEDSLKDIDVETSSVSLGGATFSILPYILSDYLAQNRGGVVILEIATCYRFMSTALEYEAILDEICFLCREYLCQPVFVNMYREGIDYSKDIMTTTIELYAKNNNFLFIDLINSISFSGNIKRLLRDGVHTTDEGSKLYAEIIANKIKDIFIRGYQAWKEKTLLKATDLLGDDNPLQFTRGGFSSSYSEVASGETLELCVPEGYLLVGVMYLMGPKTGSVLLNCPDSNFKRTIHMHDERSYYTRCSYQFIPAQKTKVVSFYQNSDMPDIDMIKGTPDRSPRIGNIIGLMVERELLIN